MMGRGFLILGAVLAGLAVAAGAFGAHALSPILTERSMQVFETATRYQMHHALALIGVALLLDRTRNGSGSGAITAAGFAFGFGILLFSGSLYALSLTGIRLLGVITPFGGVALIIGWIALAAGAWRRNEDSIRG